MTFSCMLPTNSVKVKDFRANIKYCKFTVVASPGNEVTTVETSSDISIINTSEFKCCKIGTQTLNNASMAGQLLRMREDSPLERQSKKKLSRGVMAAQHQFASVVCIVALCLSTVHRTRGVPVSEFYPFGAAAGDQMLDRSNDGSSAQEIELTAPFVLFGQAEDKLFVRGIRVS